MVDALTTAAILLGIFGGLFIAIKRNAKKSGIRPIKVIGLEGQGAIKHIVELDLVKDGDLLKNDTANKKYTVATSPVTFIDLKGKERTGYVVDIDKGCTVTLEKSESVTTLKTNPTLISNIMDSGLIREAFALRPHRGILIAVSLISIGFGIVIGLMF